MAAKKKPAFLMKGTKESSAAEKARDKKMGAKEMKNESAEYLRKGAAKKAGKKK